MARRPVTLDPKVQERLLAQMREEQDASIRNKRILNLVVFPVIGAMTVAGTVMAFSEDQSVAMVGNIFASSVLFVIWKLRKRISDRFE